MILLTINHNIFVCIAHAKLIYTRQLLTALFVSTEHAAHLNTAWTYLTVKNQKTVRTMVHVTICELCVQTMHVCIIYVVLDISQNAKCRRKNKIKPQTTRKDVLRKCPHGFFFFFGNVIFFTA
jgi:hypothetical protein